MPGEGGLAELKALGDLARRHRALTQHLDYLASGRVGQRAEYFGHSHRFLRYFADYRNSAMPELRQKAVLPCRIALLICPADGKVSARTSNIDAVDLSAIAGLPHRPSPHDDS